MCHQVGVYIEMHTDDGLMLNIFSSSDDGKKKRKPESLSVSSSPKRQKKAPSQRGRSSEGKKDGAKEGKVSSHGSGQVFSSLFNKNPEIPKLELSKVQQAKEEIFSIKLFTELKLHPYMVSNLEKEMGFEKATTVQEKAIPVVMKGGDVLIKSQTGSGKTLAYGIPIVQELQSTVPKVQRSDGVYAVILVPTRELAMQSFETIQKLVKPYHWIVPGCITGGERKKSEKARLRKGVNVLVATPGRLVDHIENTAALQFWKLRWLVLDEADRLLDMGFEKEVAAILNAINSQSEGCQRLLLSATLSQGVERLAGIALNNPTFIDAAKDGVSLSSKKDKDESVYIPEDEMAQPQVEEEDVNFTIPKNLNQYYLIVPSKLRLVTLMAHIFSKCKHSSGAKMLIFLSNCDSVEFHYTLMKEVLNSEDEQQTATEHLKIFRLHGNMDQKVRKEVHEKFHNRKSGVLLCTDVAARGLDLPDVNWIVQYNTPGTPAEYVHRVGRTARVGRSGYAVIFLAPSEVEYVQTLRNHKISLEEVDHTEILSTLLESAPPELLTDEVFNQRPPKRMEEAATRVQKKLEDFVHSKPDHTKLARKAYLSFIRAYTTYPSSLKHIFHIKKLHLGHLAKSFGLREAPSKFKNKGAKPSARQKHSLQDQQSRKSKPHKKGKVSEFGSGLEGNLVTGTQFKHPQSKKKIKKKR